MVYVTTALKSEAQAIVDRYKLKKSKCNAYTIFSNDTITIIISGIGTTNMKNATKTLLDNFDIKDEYILNIGICGASKRFCIGEVIEIDSIIYKNHESVLNQNKQNTITCLDVEVSNNDHEIVDMESSGFYQAVKERKNVKIFKIVSDHFEPKLVTKDKTKSLIFDVIDDILKDFIG